jgi:hypothetical protein
MRLSTRLPKFDLTLEAITLTATGIFVLWAKEAQSLRWLTERGTLLFNVWLRWSPQCIAALHDT